MNRKKRGRPCRIAESYVMFLAVIRYLFSLGYRQLEGLPYSFSDRLLMDGLGGRSSGWKEFW
jgi:hypothetical protein